MPKKVSVALAQISCKVGDKKHNVNVMKKNVKEAKKRNANFIIFPELSLTGYVSRDLAYELAEPIPGPAIRSLEKVTKRENIYLVWGCQNEARKHASSSTTQRSC